MNSYRDMVDLVGALRSGEVELLITYDVNLAFTLPGALDAGPHSNVCRSSRASRMCWTRRRRGRISCCPRTARSSPGATPNRGPAFAASMQPVMQPLFDSRHVGDMLIDVARRLGDDVANDVPGRTFQYMRADWQASHKQQVGWQRLRRVLGRSARTWGCLE